jgi:hypothetical protein
MFKVVTDWNPKQALLSQIIRKKDKFEEAKDLCIQMHQMIHLSRISGIPDASLADEVWNELTENSFTIMPTEKDVTIAWNIWHITRIEDITMNILINDSTQVLNDYWLRKLNVSLRDTGNAMSDEEILSFSKAVNKEELKNYRNAVGKQTQEALKNLIKEDIHRKVSADRLNRILNEGGVTNQSESIWLLDFWGKKDVAGILLMPITRHQVVHLNDCLKLKNKINRMKLT